MHIYLLCGEYFLRFYRLHIIYIRLTTLYKLVDYKQITALHHMPTMQAGAARKEQG
jgi:hypothetical protein